MPTINMTNGKEIAMRKINATRSMLEFDNKVFDLKSDKTHIVHQGRSVWSFFTKESNDKFEKHIKNNTTTNNNCDYNPFKFVKFY